MNWKPNQPPMSVMAPTFAWTSEADPRIPSRTSGTAVRRSIATNAARIAATAAKDPSVRSEAQPASGALRGRARTGLPPYGVDEALRLSPTERREFVVVEGLIDVHRLRFEGFANVAAAGGAHVQAGAVIRLRRRGVESVVLAFDNDAPGREGAARAVEAIVRAKDAPTVRVVAPLRLADAKDPDAFVRSHG